MVDAPASTTVCNAPVRAALLAACGSCRVSSDASTGVCSGARDGAMARYQLISGPERRRRWSEEQKLALVAAAFAPGAIVSEVARRADVCSGQLYRWRQELGGGAA